MKRRQLIFFLGIFLLLISLPAFLQKKLLTDEEEVTEMITKEIDELFRSKAFLKQKDKKFKDVKGTLTIDTGIIQSGKCPLSSKWIVIQTKKNILKIGINDLFHNELTPEYVANNIK